ncbi:MAG: SPOR domain-containing protein [Pedobacter sp.]|nr:MAG: SPOR domain-containing protein [Pedobacter sp.]
MKKLFILVLFLFIFKVGFAQTKGNVTIIKDPLIDSLIAKRIELNTKRPTTTNPTSSVIVSQTGYRVQIFYGLDRRETFNEQSRFKALYPRLNTYITYKEPNYYLRVGDFRTRLEAQNLLNELRAHFPTLFIFREKINAPNLEPANK